MNALRNIRTWRPAAGAIATGLLLAAGFAPLQVSLAAWVALVPLLLAVCDASPGRAFRLGFGAGTVFWILSISWLRHVTIPGCIGLAMYCALFVAPVPVAASFWMRRFGTVRGVANVGLMILVAATWAGFEYARSTFLTGFPWNPLAATQYRNLVLIQLARWGGVYAVSALIAFVNAAIALTVLRYVPRRMERGKTIHPEMIVGFAVLAVAALLGRHVLASECAQGDRLRVMLIQPNFPIGYYYDKDRFDYISDQMRNLTGLSLIGNQPDLVVWPETALADEVRTSPESYELVEGFAKRGVPMLVGTMDTEWRDDGPRYFNSSVLFDTNGIIVSTYDKRHLVMFGEYVPLKRVCPFLRALTPIQESFTPGSSSTVFRLEKPAVALSSLICFEDTVADLARESVRNGARLLVNQTNDGWFDPSSQSLQHMILCVFRCVENGVPAARCCVTGVSCLIDRSGRIHDVLQDGQGRSALVSGFRAGEVFVPADDMPLTFYTRHGDVFAVTSLILAIGLAAMGARGRA